VAGRQRWGGLSKELWLIQVKATNGKAISIDRDKARDLLSRAKKMGANCAFAIRFGRPMRWRAYEFEIDRKNTARTRRLHLDDGDKLEDVFRMPTVF
jgi:Holliday junction resolvase